MTPVVAFMAMLLTLTDGHGDVSMGGALRVIILSGAADGQEVPHGARTVERDYTFVNLCFGYPNILTRIGKVYSTGKNYLPERWRP